MKLIADCQYFPPVCSYFAWSESTHAVFELYDRYRKASFRNRAIVATAGGAVVLSIPVAGGRDQKVCTRDVRIDYSRPWRRDHLRTIESAYRRSPFFDYHWDEVRALYGTEPPMLADWNLATIGLAARKLGLPAPYSVTEGWTQTYDSAEWTDLRDRVTPANYQHMDGLRYRQVFEERTGFLPNLSVLDLLFCAGAMPAPRR